MQILWCPGVSVGNRQNAKIIEKDRNVWQTKLKYTITRDQVKSFFGRSEIPLNKRYLWILPDNRILIIEYFRLHIEYLWNAVNL